MLLKLDFKLILVVILLLFTAQTVYSSSTEDIANIYESFSKTFTDNNSKEAVELLNHWDKYLQDLTGFSNKNYLISIQNLQNTYYQAAIDVEKCINEEQKSQENYSNKWKDDLIQQFGKKYLKKNKNEIIDNFKAIATQSIVFYCRDELKELFYNEIMLRGAYKRYMSLFLDFYKTLSQDEQTQLTSLKKFTDSFLKILSETSFQDMYCKVELEKEVSKARAIEANKALYDFFKKSSLLKNFDLIKAMEDFQQVMAK